MVEFALIGPLFFLFIVVIIQGALYVNAQDNIDNMTREIARAYAVCGTTTGGWTYRGQPYGGCKQAALAQKDTFIGFLPQSSVGSFQVSICTGANIPSNGHCSGRSDAVTTAGQQVDVTVNYTYTFYFDPLLGSAGPTVPMGSSARMVAQQ